MGERNLSSARNGKKTAESQGPDWLGRVFKSSRHNTFVFALYLSRTVRLHRWCHEISRSFDVYYRNWIYRLLDIACFMLLPRGHHCCGTHKCYLGCAKQSIYFSDEPRRIIKFVLNNRLCVFWHRTPNVRGFRALFFSFFISLRMACDWLSFSCKQIITRYMIPTRWDVCLSKWTTGAKKNNKKTSLNYVRSNYLLSFGRVYCKNKKKIKIWRTHLPAQSVHIGIWRVLIVLVRLLWVPVRRRCHTQFFFYFGRNNFSFNSMSSSKWMPHAI